MLCNVVLQANFEEQITICLGQQKGGSTSENKANMKKLTTEFMHVEKKRISPNTESINKTSSQLAMDAARVHPIAGIVVVVFVMGLCTTVVLFSI